jgi:hypothetical protein
MGPRPCNGLRPVYMRDATQAGAIADYGDCCASAALHSCSDWRRARRQRTAARQGCTRGHAGHRISRRGTPGPIGFPEKNAKISLREVPKSVKIDDLTLSPLKNPPLISFPAPRFSPKSLSHTFGSCVTQKDLHRWKNLGRSAPQQHSCSSDQYIWKRDTGTPWHMTRLAVARAWGSQGRALHFLRKVWAGISGVWKV